RMDVHADLDPRSARQFEDHSAGNWINENGMVDEVRDGSAVSFAGRLEFGEALDVCRSGWACRVTRRPVPFLLGIDRDNEGRGHGERSVKAFLLMTNDPPMTHQ